MCGGGGPVDQKKNPVLSDGVLRMLRRFVTKVAGTGFEQPLRNPENLRILGQGGAECGALDAMSVKFDPDLAVVTESWPRLPETIKAGILAMVRAINS